MVALEDRAAGPLLALGLLAARRGVVGIGRAEELLDEELPPAPFGERPLAESGADHLEVLQDGVTVDHVAGLHKSTSSGAPSAVSGFSSTPSATPSTGVLTTSGGGPCSSVAPSAGTGRRWTS